MFYGGWVHSWAVFFMAIIYELENIFSLLSLENLIFDSLQ